MKMRIVILGGLLCVVGVSALTAEQFVLPQQKTKKLSKNELKESVGQEIRDAFMITTNVAKCAGMCQVAMGKEQEGKNLSFLQKTFGNLHIELAQLQQKFSQLVERLIDDQKPFKHASRDKLNKALEVMQNVQGGLKGHEEKLSKVARECTNIALNKVAADAASDIKIYAKQIDSCEGLKTT